MIRVPHIPSSSQLWRSLRREHISRAVVIVKILFLFYGGILLAYTIRESMRGFLLGSSRTRLLTSQVSLSVASNSEGILLPQPPADYEPLAKSTLFGPLEVATPAATPPPQKAVVKTPFTLIGTFITPDEPASAIVETSKGAIQDVFLLGESVFGEALLKKVTSTTIELDRNGDIEILTLEGGDVGPPVPVMSSNGSEVIVAETEVDAALANLPLLLTQLRAVPYFKEGKAIGLRVFAIKSGSLFEKIGLKNGDILKTINGNSLGDFSEAIKLFEKLKNERQIMMLLERNREDKEFKYLIR
jgi:general secretion pathway protein C